MKIGKCNVPALLSIFCRSDADKPPFDDEESNKGHSIDERVPNQGLGEDEFFTAADLNQYMYQDNPTALNRTFEQFSRYEGGS